MDQVKHSIMMLQIAKVIINIYIKNMNKNNAIFFLNLFRILHSLLMDRIELHLCRQIMISLV